MMLQWQESEVTYALIAVLDDVEDPSSGHVPPPQAAPKQPLARTLTPVGVSSKTAVSPQVCVANRYLATSSIFLAFFDYFFSRL